MVTTLTAQEVFPDTHFPLTVIRRCPQPPFPYHRHEFDELVIVTGGFGAHVTDEDAVHITAGDIFVVQAGAAHGFTDLHGLSLVNVVFRAAHLVLPYQQLERLPGYHALFHLEPRLRQPGRPISRLHVTPDTLAQLTTQLSLLEEELARRAVGYEAMALGAFTQLIVTCARAYGQLLTPTSHAMLRLGDVLSAIHTRYSEPLSMQDLAAIAYLSPSHLARLFHEAVGLAPIAYLIRFRMHHAAELLRQSTRSVAEIAQAVGYADSNYFTRQFKLTMGISPLAYRKSADRLGAAAR